MNIGTVVKSMYGHDAGSFYVIVSDEVEFVTIADGRRRKLSKPKRKNKKHLSVTKTKATATELSTDKKIRQFLWPFNFGDEKTEL